MNIIQTIPIISEKIEAENNAFINHLKQQDSATIDAKVFALNDIITPQINCLQCGNCCKTLMINVTDTEADNLANHLEINRQNFDTKYLEKGTHHMVVNTIPCTFLEDKTCTIYQHRFSGCREFPALHLPNFTSRLFTTFMHYNRCPIIYNVVEELKKTI